MTEEMAALEKNDTWFLVSCNPKMNLLSSKWVYKHKLNNKGKIIQHKARLVAVGSNQKDDIEFTKTFVLIVKPSTIRIVYCRD